MDAESINTTISRASKPFKGAHSPLGGARARNFSPQRPLFKNRPLETATFQRAYGPVNIDRFKKARGGKGGGRKRYFSNLVRACKLNDVHYGKRVVHQVDWILRVRSVLCVRMALSTKVNMVEKS